MNAAKAPSLDRIVDAANGTAARRAWTAVAILCCLNAVALLDRNIVGLLVEPLQKALGISELQVSLLFGVGFVAVYVLAGLPLAHAADHWNRRRLLIGGVTMWSLTTIASAFAADYGQLLVLRAGVAIGEAVLTPITVSLIADLFTPTRRALPTSVYATVGAVSGSGSYAIGAGAVAVAGALGTQFEIDAWRLTLIIVGVPGLVLIGLFAAFVPEPPRAGIAAGRHPESAREALRYFGRHAGLYLGVFLAVGAMMIVGMALLAWGPVLLIRTYHLTAVEAGLAFGSAAGIGSLSGALCVPWFLRSVPPTRQPAVIVNLGIGFAIVASVALGLSLLSPVLPIVLAGIAVGVGALAGTVILSPLLIQAISPERLRARMTATYILVSLFAALSLGPVLVSLLAANHPEGIQGAIRVISWCAGGAATLCYAVAYLALDRSVD